jgi:hypothetical protein
MNRIVSALLSAAALTVIHAIPSEAFTRQMCEACRRNYIDSPSRITFSIDHGRRIGRLYVCSPVCMFETLEDYPDDKPGRPSVILWKDRADPNGLMNLVEDVVWLLAVKGDKEKSHPPLCAAFKTKEEAKEAQKNLGGEIRDWKKVAEKCRRVASDEEPEKKKTPDKRVPRH